MEGKTKNIQGIFKNSSTKIIIKSSHIKSREYQNSKINNNSIQF